MHVLIDSCIYRGDPKRDKPPFRAIVRLAKARTLHRHIPAFVRGEKSSPTSNTMRATRSTRYERPQQNCSRLRTNQPSRNKPKRSSRPWAK